VLGGLEGAATDNAMYLLPGTDVWYRTYRLPSDLRTLYWFAVSEDQHDWRGWRSDQLNPDRFVYAEADDDADLADLAASVLELPHASAAPWRRSTSPHGVVSRSRLSSSVLGNVRDVHLYLPPDERLVAHREFPIAVIFDGRSYMDQIGAARVFDYLIASRMVAPFIAGLPESLNQETLSRELGCNIEFVDFVIDELFAWVEERVPVRVMRRGALVLGASFGGLAAAFCALERPDVFGSPLFDAVFMCRSVHLVWWVAAVPAASPSTLELVRGESPQGAKSFLGSI
jgi:hypothetical protein